MVRNSWKQVLLSIGAGLLVVSLWNPCQAQNQKNTPPKNLQKKASPQGTSKNNQTKSPKKIGGKKKNIAKKGKASAKKGQVPGKKGKTPLPKAVLWTQKAFFTLLNQWSSMDLQVRARAQYRIFRSSKALVPLLHKNLQSPPLRWKHLRPSLVEIAGILFCEQEAPGIFALAQNQFKAEFSYRISLDISLYQKTLYALGTLRYGPSRDFLIKVVRRSKIYILRYQALEALGKILKAPISRKMVKKLLAIFFREQSHTMIRQQIGRLLEAKKFSPKSVLKTLSPGNASLLLGNYTSPESLQILLELAKKYYGKIRADAIIELGRRKAKIYLPFFAKWLFSPDVQVEKATLYGLSLIGDRTIYHLLKKYAFWKGTSRRQLVAPILLSLLKPGDRELVAYFLSCLSSLNPFLKGVALDGCKILNYPQINSALFSYMYSSNTARAIEITGLLASRGNSYAKKRLIALAKRYGHRPRFGAKVAVAQAQSGDPKAIDRLFQWALDPKNRQAGYAIKALWKFHSKKISLRALGYYQKGGPMGKRAFQIVGGFLDPTFGKALFHALGDPRLSLRLQALQYIKKLPSLSPSASDLLQIIAQLHHPYTNLVAQDLMVRWESGVLPLLAQVLSSSRALQRWNILMAMVRLKGPFSADVQKILNQYLASSDAYLLGASLLVLARSKGNTALLAKKTRDGHFYVRIMAFLALKGRHDPLVDLALQRGLDDANLGVRITAYKTALSIYPSPDSLSGYNPSLSPKKRKKILTKWKKWLEKKKGKNTSPK